MIGQTLSHYRITAALGAGGMGEVYRATDTNLGRDVAIKVLPSEVVQDPERLGRFKREAHLLAALNHPNIAAIHGLEEADAKPFLVLELVEGEDLKQRLERGAIPVDEALEIAQQVAEALEEAHNKGIVHRDLKPANVKLTPDGKVKVLDFGLAKAWAGDAPDGSSSSAALSQSPTLANTGTVAGLILGTAAYMSPEQARGKPVDKRADVWSFGVLLWEMLTGRTLFAGDTVTDVIAAVVRQEPDLDALPATTPHAVRRLVARCLRKDPRTRLPDIGGARLELQDVVAGTAAEGDAPAADTAAATMGVERRSRTRERWTWAAVAVTLAGIAAFLLFRLLAQAPETRPAAHFVVETPEDLAFGAFDPPALSPDGRALAFVGLSPTGTAQLWIRPLDAPEVRALPGTEGAGRPFWSPDSTSIAFAAGGEIRKILLAGGTVQRVCALLRGNTHFGGTWNAEGTIVFSAGGLTANLYSVSAAGGEARLLTPHDESRGETAHWWPQFLPDGHHLLFQVAAAGEEHGGLHVTSLEEPSGRRRVLPDNSRFRYSEPGQLLFARDGVLLAQDFDAERMATTGEAVPIATGVAAWAVNSDWGEFSASAAGLVTWISGNDPEVQLEWLDRKGGRLGTLGEAGSYGQIVLSPDDRRVAVEITGGEGQWDIWVLDVARGVASRLTTGPANERDPGWSPDSQTLMFSSTESGDQDLLRKDLQGSEPAAPLPGGIGQTPGERDIAKEWLREGNTLLYKTVAAGESAIWALSLDGDGKPESLVKGFGADQPHVSPDGRWLAYITTESGRYEVYVEPFRRRGERVRVSANGGGQPRWRGDGKELFYLSLDGSLMAVDVGEGATGPEVGIPTTLVSAPDLEATVQGPDYHDYAVSADGQRFLVKRSAESDRRRRIHVLLNWPSLLE
jgi:Tol biopolymer transport system component